MPIGKASDLEKVHSSNKQSDGVCCTILLKKFEPQGNHVVWVRQDLGKSFEKPAKAGKCVEMINLDYIGQAVAVRYDKLRKRAT